MKRISSAVKVIVVASAAVGICSAANAAPRQMSDIQLDRIVGGAPGVTPVQIGIAQDIGSLAALATGVGEAVTIFKASLGASAVFQAIVDSDPDEILQTSLEELSNVSNIPTSTINAIINNAPTPTPTPTPIPTSNPTYQFCPNGSGGGSEVLASQPCP